MRILQIVPAVEPGTGVEGVAYHLEQEWARMGHICERVTNRPDSQLSSGLFGRVRHELRMVNFTLSGTIRARRRLRSAPPIDITVCHNDAMIGDVYINHGILVQAMRARGHAWWRMLRNPGHVFIWLRDLVRFVSPIHRVVVSLTEDEDRTLRRAYPLVRPVGRIIGNGVNTEEFRADTMVRDSVRRRLRCAPGDQVALFVGHEFGRKRLPLCLQALRELPEWKLWVVGGTPEMVAEMAALARRLDVRDRVILIGQSNPLPYYQAADVLLLPSAYEAFSMVMLEALSCGLPVVATPTGATRGLIQDGLNGLIIRGSVAGISGALRRLSRLDRDKMGKAARETAERHSWEQVAKEYLQLFAEMVDKRSGRPLRIVHAVCSVRFAGVERHISVLARAQAEAGHHVRVIGGDTVLMPAALAGASIGWRPGGSVNQVRQAIGEWRDADVLHVHMTAAEVAASLAWPARGVPAVTTRHFASVRGSTLAVKLAALVFRTRFAAQVAVSRYVAGRIDGPSITVPTGVREPTRLCATSRERIVLVAQRLEPEKATDLAIEAFGLSGLGEKGWRLIIAGEGSQREALEASVRAWQLTSCVDFLGLVADLGDLMGKAAILLAPCPVEGLGLTALEAMAAGLPVVAAAAGGHLETVGLASHAALFRPGDAKTAAGQLERLAMDDVARTAYGAELQCIQREKFTLDAQVAATDAVYRSVL